MPELIPGGRKIATPPQVLRLGMRIHALILGRIRSRCGRNEPAGSDDACGEKKTMASGVHEGPSPAYGSARRRTVGPPRNGRPYRAKAPNHSPFPNVIGLVKDGAPKLLTSVTHETSRRPRGRGGEAYRNRTPHRVSPSLSFLHARSNPPPHAFLSSAIRLA